MPAFAQDELDRVVVNKDLRTIESIQRWCFECCDCRAKRQGIVAVELVYDFQKMNFRRTSHLQFPTFQDQLPKLILEFYSNPPPE